MQKASKNFRAILILLFFLICSQSIYTQNSNLIRIGILLEQNEVNITSSSNLTLLDENQKIIFSGKDFSFKIKDSEFYVNNFKINSSKITAISSFILVNKRPYRGKIEILKDKDEKFTVINELNIEEYLYGVMKMEVSPAWPEETLKAQAVASRTYALSNLGKYKEEEFDLTSTVKDQVYAGVLGEDPRTNKAVDSTKGEVLTYGGNLARIIYCADGGGYTEDMEDVFNVKLPYLISVPDYAPDSPYREWSIKYKEEDLRKLFLKRNLNVGKIYKIIPAKLSRTKRVSLVRISHSQGELEITGEKLRSILGYDNLRSTLFEIFNEQERKEKILFLFSEGENISFLTSYGKITQENYGITIVHKEGVKSTNEFVSAGVIKISSSIGFRGKGWGHGVGMSQWGAKYLGKQGYNYKDILYYYYPGVSIEKIY